MDLVFVDPPYRMGMLLPVLEELCSLDILASPSTLVAQSEQREVSASPCEQSGDGQVENLWRHPDNPLSTRGTAMSSKLVIYPGTFDPITNGHISVVSRALKIFDRLVIAILNNPNKLPLFTMEERIQMIRDVLKDQRHVEVESFNGLLVDYVIQKKTNVVIRGLRALSDFEYEFQMALMNRKLNREVQSIFLMTDYKWFYTSSTIIKEAASLGGDVSGLGPSDRLQETETKIRVLKRS